MSIEVVVLNTVNRIPADTAIAPHLAEQVATIHGAGVILRTADLGPISGRGVFDDAQRVASAAITAATAAIDELGDAPYAAYLRPLLEDVRTAASAVATLERPWPIDDSSGVERQLHQIGTRIDSAGHELSAFAASRNAVYDALVDRLAFPAPGVAGVHAEVGEPPLTVADAGRVANGVRERLRGTLGDRFAGPRLDAIAQYASAAPGAAQRAAADDPELQRLTQHAVAGEPRTREQAQVVLTNLATIHHDAEILANVEPATFESADGRQRAFDLLANVRSVVRSQRDALDGHSFDRAFARRLDTVAAALDAAGATPGLQELRRLGRFVAYDAWDAQNQLSKSYGTTVARPAPGHQGEWTAADEASRRFEREWASAPSTMGGTYDRGGRVVSA